MTVLFESGERPLAGDELVILADLFGVRAAVPPVGELGVGGLEGLVGVETDQVGHGPVQADASG